MWTLTKQQLLDECCGGPGGRGRGSSKGAHNAWDDLWRAYGNKYFFLMQELATGKPQKGPLLQGLRRQQSTSPQKGKKKPGSEPASPEKQISKKSKTIESQAEEEEEVAMGVAASRSPPAAKASAQAALLGLGAEPEPPPPKTLDDIYGEQLASPVRISRRPKEVSYAFRPILIEVTEEPEEIVDSLWNPAPAMAAETRRVVSEAAIDVTTASEDTGVEDDPQVQPLSASISLPTLPTLPALPTPDDPQVQPLSASISLPTLPTLPALPTPDKRCRDDERAERWLRDGPAPEVAGLSPSPPPPRRQQRAGQQRRQLLEETARTRRSVPTLSGSFGAAPGAPLPWPATKQLAERFPLIEYGFQLGARRAVQEYASATSTHWW
eukprot:TRINITY_DN25005_c0_g1_i2.p1 TRINITY_DN25005_c0_g1~~TRINITY_DN25005_c0_g1_i2.p1  ORF type:complete len:381 (-),score=84.90 TRINITY_DN25005_c0_g1_i2:48-1190(-)